MKSLHIYMLVFGLLVTVRCQFPDTICFIAGQRSHLQYVQPGDL